MIDWKVIEAFILSVLNDPERRDLLVKLIAIEKEAVEE